MTPSASRKRQPSLKNSLVNYRLQKACANCRKKRWIPADRGWWQCQDEWHAGGRIKRRVRRARTSQRRGQRGVTGSARRGRVQRRPAPLPGREYGAGLNPSKWATQPEAEPRPTRGRVEIILGPPQPRVNAQELRMATGPGGHESRPYFKLYARDFLASPKFAKMDAEERGVYLTLLLRSWINDGVLVDPVDLADEVGLEVQEVESILEGRVGRCFNVDDEGRWRSPRLERERAEASALSAKRKAAGAKGGRAIGKQLLSKPKPPESESESVSECSHPQSPSNSPTALKRPPKPPKGGRSMDPAKLTGICETAGLDHETTKAVLEWHLYRQQMGKPLTNATWQRLAVKAAREPGQFRASVAFTIEMGWQGLRAPEPAQGNTGRLTGRVQVQRQNTDVGRSWVEKMESGQAPSIREIEGEGSDD